MVPSGRSVGEPILVIGLAHHDHLADHAGMLVPQYSEQNR